MSAIKDIYDLIKDLLEEAETSKNESLMGKLITIEKSVYTMEKENQKLKEMLDIRKTMKYDESAETFTLPDNPNVHFCSICYGVKGKLVPTSKNDGTFHCRNCYLNKYRGKSV